MGLHAAYVAAYLYTCAGRPDHARPLLEATLDANRKGLESDLGCKKEWFENVAVHAMLGDRDAALSAWERAVEAGFPDGHVHTYDPLIAPMKGEPRFVAALDRLRRRNAEMRGRVDFRVIDEWIARGAPTVH